MTGNVGVLREMCQPRALLRYRSNRRLSFRAQSPPPSTGVVVALGLIALVFPAPGSPARAQDASTPGAQDFVPVVNSPVEGQAAEPIGTSEASRGAPLTLTFQDALERARHLDPLLSLATADAESAHQDRVQARAALLPSVNLTNAYLFTQGNGVLASGRYVTNDGVHVYRVWGVFHQDISANTFTLTSYRRAAAAEMLARAKLEIARRGLKVTVTKAYYDLVIAERKYATAEQSLASARHFLQISQDLEHGGEVAHSDVIKFELQANQADQAFREAKLAMENARLSLAVMLFPDFNENFTVVDDLNSMPPLPPLDDAQALAGRQNPQLRAAFEALRESQLDVSTARQAFLPSLTVDTPYGIEANHFALRSRVNADPEKGRLPNLGYFMTATITLPVWNWGALRSKLKQAQFRLQQAHTELSFTQRELISNLLAAYNEADTARSGADTLRKSADLAAESQRLNTLRYQAGEATVLELVDAANALVQARNAYDDGAARYRLALANLQILTGDF
jgi:outer membrane protein TolC